MNVQGGEQRPGPIDRRQLLKAGGLGLAMVASGGLLHKPFGSAFAAFVRRLPSAQELEIQMFQTAASLENLAVAAYAKALELPAVHQNPVLHQFVVTTMEQHADHGEQFNDHADELGGSRQDALNPRYAEIVLAAMPATSNAAAAMQLAATLEEAMTDTYLANLTLSRHAPTRALMASVMGVESQHLAVLRVFGGLISGGHPELVAIPTDPSALPVGALSAAFPQPFEGSNLASPPAEGAV
jgi:hypothetical protein